MIRKLKTKFKNVNWPKFSKKTIKLFIILFLLALISPFLLHFITEKKLQNSMFSSVDDIPARRVAIVFGAAIWDEETPSHVLRDRILTAVDLYNAGKVEKIIMTGDNRFENYDEPGTMIKYAIEQGVPKNILQPDYAGRRTYDSCYRARHIFGLEEAILVTQDFHLPRALFTCQGLGIDSIGISADLTSYVNADQMQLRDVYALSLAMIDIYIRKPGVVLGEEIEL